MEDLTGLGQRNLASRTADQLVAQHLFQLANAAGQGALVDRQPFGRAAEREFYGDNIERLDVARAWNLGHFHPCLPEERALMQYCP